MKPPGAAAGPMLANPCKAEHNRVVSPRTSSTGGLYEAEQALAAADSRMALLQCPRQPIPAVQQSRQSTGEL
jgi:hypothetical protein